MFILKKGHQPGVYVPLRALFLVEILLTGTRIADQANKRNQMLLNVMSDQRLLCLFAEFSVKNETKIKQSHQDTLILGMEGVFGL